MQFSSYAIQFGARYWLWSFERLHDSTRKFESKINTYERQLLRNSNYDYKTAFCAIYAIDTKKYSSEALILLNTFVSAISSPKMPLNFFIYWNFSQSSKFTYFCFLQGIKRMNFLPLFTSTSILLWWI